MFVMKLEAFYVGRTFFFFCSADNGSLLGDSTQRYSKPSLLNEGLHTVKCYPSVMGTELPYQSIMNETDNNVTEHFIQMILQQSDLWVMMLFI